MASARARLARAGYKPKERDIVLAILQYLKAKHRDWHFTRSEPPGAVRARAFRATSDGRIRNWKQPEDAWGDGQPDIWGVGRVYDVMADAELETVVAFEVKSPTGRQSEAQKDWQARFEKSGGRYYVVRSVEDVQRAMEEVG